MKHPLYFLLLIILITLNANAQKSQWGFELHGGLPYNVPLPLTITQQNEPTIHFNAKYSSQPMTPPVYWVWRFSKWKNGKGWELEAIHHKLYLDNIPDEIQEFTITHGYNIVTVNRSFEKLLFQKHSYILRLGAGIVLAHPENEVRNQKLYPHDGLFELGYYISGPVLNLTVGKRFYFCNRAFLNTELKFNPSYSRVPIVSGHADVWNMAFAFVFGLGFDFIKGEE